MNLKPAFCLGILSIKFNAVNRKYSSYVLEKQRIAEVQSTFFTTGPPSLKCVKGSIPLEFTENFTFEKEPQHWGPSDMSKHQNGQYEILIIKTRVEKRLFISVMEVPFNDKLNSILFVCSNSRHLLLINKH